MPHIGRVGEHEVEALRGRLLLGEIALARREGRSLPHKFSAASANKGSSSMPVAASMCLRRNGLRERRIKRAGANRRVEEAQPPLP